MQAQPHQRTDTVGEGFSGVAYTAMPEQSQKGWSLKRLAWDIAVGVTAVAGAALGGIAFGRSFKGGDANAVAEPFGINGLIDNHTQFCGTLPLMPYPYTWGMHTAANASWAVRTNATETNNVQCQFSAGPSGSLIVNATQPDAVISWDVANPTEHRDIGRATNLDCQGNQTAFLFLNASYASEGKEASQQSVVQFEPSLCPQ